ncbi:hypothetical protein Hanom_Chr15g01400621 [Helianthus anomalus]
MTKTHPRNTEKSLSFFTHCLKMTKTATLGHHNSSVVALRPPRLTGYLDPG